VRVGRRTARPSGRRLRMTLHQIEKALVAEAPDLGSTFEIFTRLTHHEAMPRIEQALPRQWMARPRWQGRKVLIAAGLIACLGALVSVTAVFGSHACGTAAGAHQSTTQTPGCRPAPTARP
jgi:hypothetical protein